MTTRTLVVVVGGLFIVASILVAAWISSPGCIDLPGDNGECTRVLLIGNSYTYVNDLPGVFKKLAGSGGHRVGAGMLASGGQTLAGHLSDPAVADKLKSESWDIVVLQEQSQIPANEQTRGENMFPAAARLVEEVRASGAQPVLFLTWAHREGWPEVGLMDYPSMQAQLNAGYLEAARETGAAVAPVGPAWVYAMNENPDLQLWGGDGSHPGRQGTYLAACVFYAAIFRQSPLGLAYTAGLPTETARKLQAAAAEVVLQNPGQWYMP